MIATALARAPSTFGSTLPLFCVLFFVVAIASCVAPTNAFPASVAGLPDSEIAIIHPPKNSIPRETGHAHVDTQFEIHTVDLVDSAQIVTAMWLEVIDGAPAIYELPLRLAPGDHELILPWHQSSRDKDGRWDARGRFTLPVNVTAGGIYYLEAQATNRGATASVDVKLVPQGP